MLRIRRIKAVSKTQKHNFGFDYYVTEGLNLIASNKNTRGKSSVILAIYYCLGLEEIVGGKGHKMLTSVYKTEVTDTDGRPFSVLESELFLEVGNGTDIITIYRTGKMVGRDENLISVYFSALDSIYAQDTYREDMFIHSQNSTKSAKGFHSFLEKFISLNLPLVPATNDSEYKLYLQLIFSCMFIEQKRGWADLFSAMPILGILDAKKRIIEYILALETLDNEKKKTILKQQEISIQTRWRIVISEIEKLCNREDCHIRNIPSNPKILDSEQINQVLIFPYGREEILISIKIEMLKKELMALKRSAPKIIDNFDELQTELELTEESIINYENEMRQLRSRLDSESQSIINLQESYNTILYSRLK